MNDVKDTKYYPRRLNRLRSGIFERTRVGATLLGEINYGQCTIKIDDSLPVSRAREVLAHELVHALLLEAGYDDHEEEQATRVGTILAMLLRDNDFAFMKEAE